MFQKLSQIFQRSQDLTTRPGTDYIDELVERELKRQEEEKNCKFEIIFK